MESEKLLQMDAELLNERKFAFMACVNDKILYKQCLKHIDSLRIRDGYSIEKIDMVGARNINEAYNNAMKRSDAKFKIYLHQDTFIKNKNFLNEICRIFAQDLSVGMIGVVGARRLPSNGIWFKNNWWYCYGKVLEYRRGGILQSILGPLNKRKERIVSFRKVQGEFMPMVVIDGLIMITQYDIPWRTDLYGGFLYYEGPHCIEFIKRGYKVIIPAQKTPWVMHYGPRIERGKAEQRAIWGELEASMKIFREEYKDFIGQDVKALILKSSRDKKSYA